MAETTTDIQDTLSEKLPVRNFDEDRGSGRRWTLIGVGVLAVAAIAAAAYYGLNAFRAKAPVEVPVAAPAAAPAPASETPSHPIEQTEPALPATPEQADAALLAEITRLTGSDLVGKLIRPAGLVRHIVATVDALPRHQLPQQVVPTTPVPGKFLVESGDGGQVVAAANARRYLPWVHLLVSVDPAEAAAAYKRYYPLFQKAYQELGYPKGYFNDRLIEAIDDVLDASQIPARPKVVLPTVMWHYEDPDLESLSAGQKLLVRIGPTSASAVRGWLQAFRAKIA